MKEPISVVSIIGIGCLFIERAIYYWNRYRAKKNNIKNNPHSIPGMAQMCQKHSNDIGKIWTEVDDIKDDIKEMKKDFKERFNRLEDKLNGMRK